MEPVRIVLFRSKPGESEARLCSVFDACATLANLTYGAGTHSVNRSSVSIY